MANKNEVKEVEAIEAVETAEEKVARLEQELARRSVPQGQKLAEDCTKEELIEELKRLNASNSALRKLIKDFIDKV